MLNGSYFMDYQKAWLLDKSRVKFWEKSRRIGATYTESFDSLDWSMETGRDTWFSSADDSAAKEFIEYIEGWLKIMEQTIQYYSGQVELTDELGTVTAYQVKLPNGAKITAMSSNPNRFRSKGGRVVWDEAAHHKDGAAMWKALQASAMWGDPIRVLSTHMGSQSVFAQLIEKVKKGKMKASVHTVTIMDAVNDGILDRIRKRKTSEEERTTWLQELRDECIDENQWLQEYMAVASDDTDSFLSYELIAGIENSNVLWPGNQLISRAQGDLYLGMDIARKKHFSVIWVLEKIGNLKFTRYLKTMQGLDFRSQKQELYHCLQHPQLRRACIDATGLGMMLAEEAQQDFGKYKVEAVMFTPSVKEELAYSLLTEVEDKSIVIPQSTEIREDLRSVKKIVTSAKNIRFDAADGANGHADRFWALSLANMAGKTYKGQPSVGSSGARQSSNYLRGYEYDGITGY